MWPRVVLTAGLAAILAFLLDPASSPTSIVDEPDDSYDYIVVGGGTAGCVVATRLSEDPSRRVLLIEAGSTLPWYLSVPLLAPVVQQTRADWDYRSTSQRHSSFGLLERKQSLPRGRGLGGSGHINYMLHTLGRPSDFASWPGSWSDLPAQLKRASRLVNANRRSSLESLAPATRLARAARLPAGSSFKPASMSTRDGARCSTYRSYLQTAWQRPNLHILLDATVDKLLINESNRTKGLRVRVNGVQRKIAAAREVIVSAGAIGTPQLLMLSGIGPEEELNKHKIKVRVNLPAVGNNYFDHLNMPVYVKFDNPPDESISITFDNMLQISTLTDYLFDGTGFLASNGIVGMVREDSEDYGLIMTAFGSIDEKSLSRLSNYRSDTFRGLFPTYNDSSSQGFLFLAVCLQPKSRGRISLRTSEISDHPLIDPNYLQRNEDVACHVKSMRTAKRIAESREFKQYGARLHLPDLQECRNYPRDFDDDSYAACVVRTGAVTSHHHGGTCRMGSDENSSVVDQLLRVHHINGLRVVDASVLPNPISGAPNSVITAVAEKAAEIIRTADAFREET